MRTLQLLLLKTLKRVCKGLKTDLIAERKLKIQRSLLEFEHSINLRLIHRFVSDSQTYDYLV